MLHAKRWAALAALWAGLCAAGTLWAAEPTVLPPPMPMPATSVATANVTLETRDIEMLVEIELLADPTTYPHTLKAQMGQNGLELKGFVPSETIRKRAVAIATAVFPGVQDQLKVHPSIALPMPLGSNAAFSADASKRIEKVCPQAGKRVDVKSAANGTITLTGRVDSLEEKWKISHSLRGMPGCLAVKNDLEAPNAPLISRDTILTDPNVAKVVAKPQQGNEKVMPVSSMPQPEVAKPVMNPITKPGLSPLLPGSKANEPSAKQNAPGKTVGLTKSPYGGEANTVMQPAGKGSDMPKAPVAPAKQPPAKNSDGTPAIVSFDEEPVVPAKSPATTNPTPAKPVTPPAAPSKAPMSAGPTALQKTIKQNLGGTAKEVKIEPGKDGGYNIIVMQAPGYDAAAMYQMIKHLPELADPKTTVEFHKGE